jgi:recombination endonuclease VII
MPYANKQDKLAHNRSYYQTNKEFIHEQQSEYRKTESAKTLEKIRKKKNHNPEKTRLISQKYYAKNKNSISKKHRRYSLKTKYGISEQEYEIMFDYQKGRCYICKQESKFRLCVDHDHTTGKVRSLLCRRCNSVLGQVNESPFLLAGMIAYLKEHKDN